MNSALKTIHKYSSEVASLVVIGAGLLIMNDRRAEAVRQEAIADHKRDLTEACATSFENYFSKVSEIAGLSLSLQMLNQGAATNSSDLDALPLQTLFNTVSNSQQNLTLHADAFTQSYSNWLHGTNYSIMNYDAFNLMQDQARNLLSAANVFITNYDAEIADLTKVPLFEYRSPIYNGTNVNLHVVSMTAQNIAENLTTANERSVQSENALHSFEVFTNASRVELSKRE